MNKTVVIDYEQYGFEFTCDMFYGDVAKLIERFFAKVGKNVNYNDLGVGKV